MKKRWLKNQQQQPHDYNNNKNNNNNNNFSSSSLSSTSSDLKKIKISVSDDTTFDYDNDIDDGDSLTFGLALEYADDESLDCTSGNTDSRMIIEDLSSWSSSSSSSSSSSYEIRDRSDPKSLLQAIQDHKQSLHIEQRASFDPTTSDGGIRSEPDHIQSYIDNKKCEVIKNKNKKKKKPTLPPSPPSPSPHHPKDRSSSPHSNNINTNTNTHTDTFEPHPLEEKYHEITEKYGHENFPRGTNPPINTNQCNQNIIVGDWGFKNLASGGNSSWKIGVEEGHEGYYNVSYPTQLPNDYSVQTVVGYHAICFESLFQAAEFYVYLNQTITMPIDTEDVTYLYYSYAATHLVVDMQVVLNGQIVASEVHQSPATYVQSTQTALLSFSSSEKGWTIDLSFKIRFYGYGQATFCLSDIYALRSGQPLPGNKIYVGNNGSDIYGNGTAEFPFSSIRQAINMADSNANSEIVLYSGANIRAGVPWLPDDPRLVVFVQRDQHVHPGGGRLARAGQLACHRLVDDGRDPVVVELHDIADVCVVGRVFDGAVVQLLRLQLDVYEHVCLVRGQRVDGLLRAVSLQRLQQRVLGYLGRLLLRPKQQHHAHGWPLHGHVDAGQRLH
ncbi:hypothetical protein DFA_00284 [Cavenderia fasciculata]|uniref:Uncharacterized protein n=1 Tax=Cavenderia fasciculata TaxID=261658 RepID=F4PY46_CACFS|nr:uncharacterized protein DFA_00284 [Cavenderia fasciculata]EGG19706.1 hypothetical protein DFA_00284 [Cavenderia fasciculata]|eukprot:XP_004358000.1 hypothetical protein DFA_00284 [Cavenderia fasciculata]